jgi:hypothetical protein
MLVPATVKQANNGSSVKHCDSPTCREQARLCSPLCSRCYIT